MHNNPYLQTEAETLSPGQLLLRAYQDIFDALSEAKKAINENDVVTKAKMISKIDRIISILQAALDFENGGEIAKNLDYLYNASKHWLLKANLENKVEYLEHVEEILRPLYEAWEEVVKKEENSAGNNEV